MAKPHKLALFALVPRNPGAQAVLEHPHNRHLVSVFQDPKVEGQTLIGLSVGLHIVSKSRFTLATIGRSGADISVEGANISRIQCSFEVHETTEEIMLYDRSAAQTTQVCGRKSTPFRAGTVRRVVVDKKTNLEFAFGGIDRNLVHFRIVWLKSDYDLTEPISNREDHPCFARTVDDDLAIAPSIRATRIHIGGNRLDIRYSPRKQLGKGAFGTVWKIANIDTGEHYALKKMEWPELQSRKYIAMKREVEALSRLSHPNIIEYITAQGPKDDHIEIFMELKHGSVWDLIHLDDLYVRNPSAADTLFLEMLQALDYVEFKGLIHRDVKPENILYTPLPNGSYRYQLTDFGLCNAIGQARSYAGTKPYAAPELFNDPGSQQTSKMDVWSLAVTLIYAMNAGGFREKPSQPPDRRNKAVQEAVSEEDFRTLRDMVHIDPNQRASPGDMLDKLFNGAGRSTPRNLLQSDIVLVAPLRPQVQPIAMSIDTPEQSVSPVTKPPEQAIQRVRKMHTRLGARSGTRRHNATTSLGPQRSFGRARRA